MATRVQFVTDHEVGDQSYKKGATVALDEGAAASLLFSGVVRPDESPAEPQGKAPQAKKES